jgi:hypothetical protein
MSLSMRALTSRRVTNKDVQLHNRLAQFTVGPTQYDVNVVQDLSVGRNTNMNKLTVNGDLTVGGDTMVQSLDVSQNLVVTGTISAMTYLPGQIVNVNMLSNVDLSQISPSQTVNTTSTKTIFTYSYTPKIANSYIIIEYQTIYYSNGASADEIYAYLYAHDASDNRIGTTYQRWVGSGGGGTRSGALFPIVGRYTNADTVAKTIRVDIYNNADDVLTVNSDNSTWLKITEIGR